MNDQIMQVLGRIEGKLDSEIKLAEEHRDDDKRRFSDVYTKIGEHDKEIANAKGQKSVILWLAGGGAVAISALVSFLAKAKGG